VTPLQAALLAQRAYVDAPTVGFADSAARMHAYAVEGGVAHAFRGTDDFRSMVADVDCRAEDVWGLGKLHAGFFGALATILPACLALPRPVAVVGHSLGAAMAVIYAGVLAKLGHVVSVYAFEPPRLCADDVLAGLLRAAQVPLYATRNGNDIVTQLPVNLMLPCDLTAIGRASLPLPNVTDHGIDRVIHSLLVAGGP
jgi:hypothetical protein